MLVYYSYKSSIVHVTNDVSLLISLLIPHLILSI
jgi:hypothetical protein